MDAGVEVGAGEVDVEAALGDTPTVAAVLDLQARVRL